MWCWFQLHSSLKNMEKRSFLRRIHWFVLMFTEIKGMGKKRKENVFAAEQLFFPQKHKWHSYKPMAQSESSLQIHAKGKLTQCFIIIEIGIVGANVTNPSAVHISAFGCRNWHVLMILVVQACMDPWYFFVKELCSDAWEWIYMNIWASTVYQEY